MFAFGGRCDVLVNKERAAVRSFHSGSVFSPRLDLLTSGRSFYLWSTFVTQGQSFHPVCLIAQVVLDAYRECRRSTCSARCIACAWRHAS